MHSRKFVRKSGVALYLGRYVRPDSRPGGGAMAELFRVLAPGGHAVVMVPIEMDRPKTYEDASIDSAAGRDVAFGHPYHVRICGADYPDRLRRAGFGVKLVYSRSMTPHMRRFWRINKTVLFDCRKP
jgi:hypothetical protein